jgi:hypothetical protein
MFRAAAGAFGWSRPVDAGRRTAIRHSGGATGLIDGWRSCAAGRLQTRVAVGGRSI